MDKNFDYYANLAQKALDAGNKDDAKIFMDQAKSLVAAPVAAPQAEAVDSEVTQEEGKGFLGAAAEVPVNISAGVGSMVREVGETIDWAADAMQNWAGEPMSLDVDNASPEALRIWEDSEGVKLFDAFGTQIKWMTGEDMQELKATNLYNMLDLGDAAEAVLYTDKDAQLEGKQETLAGGLTHGITQFLSGYAVLGGVKTAQSAGYAAQAALAAGKGAVVDFAAFDAHEARASDLMLELGLEGEWLRYLASDEEDTILEGKMKNAIEGLGLGVVAEGAFLFLKSAGKYGKSKIVKDSDANIAKAEELEQEAMKLADEAREKTFKDPTKAEITDVDGTPIATVTDADAAIFKGEEAPTYYHGTTDLDFTEFRLDKQENFRQFGDGIYLAKDKGNAERYAKDNGRVIESTINGKVASNDDYTRVELERNQAGDYKLGHKARVNNINKSLEEEGFVGVDLGSEVVVFKPENVVIKTKPTKVELDESQAPIGAKLPDPNDPLQGAKGNEKLRNEKGDFRTFEAGVGREYSKTVSWKESNQKATRLIADLMKSNGEDGTGIIQLAKQLHDAKIDPKDADEFAAASIQMETFLWRQFEVLAKTPAAKAGDVPTVRKMETLVEALRYAQASRMGGASSNARALALQKQAKETIPDLDFDLTPEGMIRVLNNEANAGKIRKSWNSFNKIVNAMNEYWLNSLLSGASTHAINLTSNAVVAGVDILEVAGGAGIAALKNPKEGARQLRLAQRQAVGIVKYARVSAQLAGQTLRHGRNILDEEGMINEAVNNVVGDVAIGSGNLDISKVFTDPTVSMVDRVGNIIRLPSRGLMGGDELFKQVNFRAKAYAYAAEEMDKALANGEIDAGDFDMMVERRLDEAYEAARASKKGDIIADPIANIGLRASRVNTFTNDLGKPGKALQGFVGDVPLLRQVIPFIRTPINILKYPLKRSPLGLASKNMRETIEKGGEGASQAIFQLSMGTATWAGAMYLVSDSFVEVDAGKGDKMEVLKYQGSWANLTSGQKQALRASGASPNSYYDEGTGKWVSYQRLDPAAMFIGVATDVRDVLSSGEHDGAMETSTAAIIAIASQFKDKTYTKGLSDFIKAADDPARYFESWAFGKAGSFVPSAVSQFRGDQYSREVRTLADAMKNRIPTLSNTLENTYDILGQPNVKPDGFLMKKTEWKDDVVRSEMFRLAPSIGKPSERHSSGVDLPDFKNEDGLTAYARYNQLIGEVKRGGKGIKDALERQILSYHYQNNLTDGSQTPDGKIDSSREKQLKKVVNKYRETAMRQLRKEYPELDQAIKQKEKENKAGQRQRTAGESVFKRQATYGSGTAVDTTDLLNGLF